MDHALIVEDLPEIRAWLGDVARAAFPQVQVTSVGRRDEAVVGVRAGAHHDRALRGHKRPCLAAAHRQSGGALGERGARKKR